MTRKSTTIQGLLIDLSGVLHNGPDAIPGSADALRRLRASNMPLRFVSNTSRKTRKQLHASLQDMGFAIEIDEIFTAPRAAHNWLQENHCQTMLLVHPDLEPEFTGLDITQDPGNADAVLVGDAAEGFSHASMNRVFRALKNGAELLAIARNRYFHDGTNLSLDAGPFVVALEFAADCQARLFGKPSADFFHAAVSDMRIPAESVLMIGDDVESDVNGALSASLQAALVRTGKYTSGDETGTTAACYADFAEIVRDLIE